MIDFRYHLVSIASVFLALAVGIVLGAGPLRGTIGDTLASEVTRLREEANTLRADLSVAEAQADARDGALADLRPRSVAGVLDGADVGVLVLPGAPDDAVEAAIAVLTEAGARVSDPVSVDQAWTSSEPPDATARSEAAAELRELLAGELPVGLDPERVIDLSLARALTAGAVDEDSEPAPPVDGEDPADSLGAGQARDVTGARVLQVLADRGLVSLSAEGAAGGADGVVVIPPEGVASEPGVVTGWVDIVGAVDDSAAAVVAGNLGSEVAIDTDLIAAIRDSGALAGRISTVDNLGTPPGATALPFAIVEQIEGESGHYGAGDTASGLLPPVGIAAP